MVKVRLILQVVCLCVTLVSCGEKPARIELDFGVRVTTQDGQLLCIAYGGPVPPVERKTSREGGDVGHGKSSTLATKRSAILALLLSRCY